MLQDMHWLSAQGASDVETMKTHVTCVFIVSTSDAPCTPTCNRQRFAALPLCVSCEAFVAAYRRPSSIPLFLHSSSAGWTTATVFWSTCLSLTSSASSESTLPQQSSFSTWDVVTTSPTCSSVSPTCRTVAGSGPPPVNSLTFWPVAGRAFPVARGVDPMCFSGSRLQTHPLF